MNLPNKLTISRIIMSLIIIFILLFDFSLIGIEYNNNVNLFNSGVYGDPKHIIAGVLFIIASLTDFLDGMIARKYGLITNTGKMLDAIADKVLVNSTLIILAIQGLVPAIVPVVVVLRDIVVNAIKMEAAGKGVVIAAIGSGKLKTASLMVGTVLAFAYNIPFELISLDVTNFLLYFATLMSIISMVQYFNMNKELIFGNDKKKNK
ncbi:MAG: CDP-diacylglycerol--glycerol-3-phosphate 3-phosphatidyltransferase [Firmicutes bacterium]|nr:CDP-diacylglycerol--glycerol-3-phosphate 3-phosphatidyltransferase [Bacillota bacterium]